MGIFESGIVSGIGCGCCCLAIAVVLAIAGALAFRGTRGTASPLPGHPSAPARGSSTSARLTFMGEPEATEVAETVQLRPAPRASVSTVPAAAPPAPPSASPAAVEPATSTPPPLPPALAQSGKGPRILTPAPTRNNGDGGGGNQSGDS